MNFKPIHADKEQFLILTQDEIQQLNNYCDKYNGENIALFYDNTSIGTIYAICPQNELKKPITDTVLTDITDYEKI